MRCALLFSRLSSVIDSPLMRMEIGRVEKENKEKVEVRFEEALEKACELLEMIPIDFG
jgi:hypothetical protein